VEDELLRVRLHLRPELRVGLDRRHRQKPTQR
jgi:hypothetical protein